MAMRQRHLLSPSSIRKLRALRFLFRKLASKKHSNSNIAKIISYTLLFLTVILLLSHSRRVPHNFTSAPNISHISGEQILSHSFASNIIVSELNRFIFCPVPKAASSNWKYLIRKFEGLHDYPDLIQAHNHNTSGLRYLSDYSPLDVQRILTDPDFFKFVFVRNPFRRLASCYMDKFLNNNQTYVHTEYRSFLAQLFSWHYVRNIDIYNQPRPSFQSFVDELTKQQPALMNAHWTPQTIHCGIGLIPYDFVGKMEHLDKSVHHALKAIGKAEHHFPTQQEINFLPSGTSRSAIAALYNPDIIAKVRALYHMDFHYLGYSTCNSRADFLDCTVE